MSDDAKTVDGAATDGGDAQTADQSAATDTGAQATAGGADAGKLVTQDEVNRIVQERLARERSKLEKEAGKTAADLQAKLDEYEAEKEQRRQEALSEDERKEEARKTAEAERDAAKTEAERERTLRLRAEAIAADPEVAAYPKRYKDAITGNTPEEIAASLVEIKAEREADVEAIRAGAKAPPPDVGSSGKVGAPPPQDVDARKKRLAEIGRMTNAAEKQRARDAFLRGE